MVVKELFHIHLDHSDSPKSIIYSFVYFSLFLISLIIIATFIASVIFGKAIHIDKLTEVIFYVVITLFVLGIPIFFAIYLTTKHSGWGVTDEVIVYDNGWVTMFGMGDNTGRYGWLVPLRLDWIFPEGAEARTSRGKLAMTIFPVINVIKKKKGRALVRVVIAWRFPDADYDKNVFGASAKGWISEEDYAEAKKMQEYMEKRAEENVKNGVKMPPADSWSMSGFMFDAYSWNDAAQQKGVLDDFKKEMGDAAPAPLIAFFDEPEKYRKYYWKTLVKTGKWPKGGEDGG